MSVFYDRMPLYWQAVLSFQDRLKFGEGGIRFSNYFGFTEGEVGRLFDIFLKTTKNPKITLEDLRIWYDGYHTASGERLYNPRSVVCALSNNQLANYWTSSGPYDEIFFYIKNNIEAVRDDLVLMTAEEGVEAVIQNYAAVSYLPGGFWL